MDIASLPAVAFQDRLSLPRTAGVYVVTDDSGEVIYVGQSQSIRHRWRNHHRAVDLVMLRDIRIGWIEEADEARRLALESEITRKYRPRLNAHGVVCIADALAADDDGHLLGASEAIRKLGIPRTSFYRLVDEKRIPVYEERKPWEKRTRKRFLLSEVREALGMDTTPAGPGPAEDRPA